MFTKRVNDPVHGLIDLSPLIVSFIDTPQFQRLRELKQLGACYYIYPGASHNRFEHSIGTMHLGEKLISTIKKNQSELEISDFEMDSVKLAGLCHDLGHGPYSHVFDNTFIKNKRPELNWHHEQGSEMMLDYLIDDNNIDIESDQIKFIKSLINPEEYINKRYLYDIVSNSRNSVDVDKFDYIQRDCYNLGIKSSYDPSRLMNYCRVIDDEICFPAKEAYNLYEMFHTRYSLFKQVYQHPVTKAVELMICDVLDLADDHFGISSSIDKPEEYLTLTDTIISRIAACKDPEVAEARELIKRINRRELYKVVNSALLPKEMEFLLPKFTAKNIILAGGDLVASSGLTFDDLTVDAYKINYAFKDKNPVDHVHFFDSRDINKKFLIGRDKVSSLIPDRFSELYVRLFVKTMDDAKFEAAQMAFGNFLHREFSDKIKASPALKRSSAKMTRSQSSFAPALNGSALATQFKSEHVFLSNTAKKTLSFSNLKAIRENRADTPPADYTKDYEIDNDDFILSQKIASNSPCPTPQIKKMKLALE